MCIAFLNGYNDYIFSPALCRMPRGPYAVYERNCHSPCRVPLCVLEFIERFVMSLALIRFLVSLKLHENMCTHLK